MKVVHAHCTATEHRRLLPEFFYQPVIRSAVHINGEQIMNSPIGGNIGPATFMCRSSEAESVCLHEPRQVIHGDLELR